MGSVPNCDGNNNGKMGIIVTGEGVHIVAAMSQKKIFLNEWRCRHSVNELLRVTSQSYDRNYR